MKKTFVVFFAMVAMAFGAQAQGYRTAIGLGVDFGNGTFAGGSIKHFLQDKAALEGDVLFGNNAVMTTALYQYHGNLANAGGLKWYLGIGPSLVFGGGTTIFGIRPNAGLDYKINNAPIALTFDWRPGMWFGNGGSNFDGAQFGFGARFVLSK